MMFLNSYTRPATPVPDFLLTDNNVLEKNSATKSPSLPGDISKKLDDLKLFGKESNPQVAEALSTLGQSCARNGNKAKALHYYNQALEISKETLPSGHPHIADVLCSIGGAMKKFDMLEESKYKFQEALTIYRKANKNRSWITDTDEASKAQSDYYLQHSTASALCSLGNIEFQQKKMTSALKYFEDALLDAKRAAVTGVVMDRKSRSSRALTKNPKLKNLKDARIFVAEMFNNLGNVHAELDNRSAATRHYNQALALQMQELGEDDPSVADTLHNMGTLHHRSGEMIFALKSYKQVLKMRRLTLGNRHPQVVHSLVNLSTLHEKAGEFDKAESALQAAMRILVSSHGGTSEPVADMRVQLGDQEARIGTEKAALEHLEIALKLYEKVEFDDSHPSVKKAKDSIEYVKNKSDENSSTNSLVEATETIGTMFNKGCGVFCFNNDASNLQTVDSRDDC